MILGAENMDMSECDVSHDLLEEALRLAQANAACGRDADCLHHLKHAARLVGLELDDDLDLQELSQRLQITDDIRESIEEMRLQKAEEEWAVAEPGPDLMTDEELEEAIIEAVWATMRNQMSPEDVQAFHAFYASRKEEMGAVLLRTIHELTALLESRVLVGVDGECQKEAFPLSLRVALLLGNPDVMERFTDRLLARMTES